jgi:hypothetical protein
MSLTRGAPVGHGCSNRAGGAARHDRRASVEEFVVLVRFRALRHCFPARSAWRLHSVGRRLSQSETRHELPTRTGRSSQLFIATVTSQGGGPETVDAQNHHQISNDALHLNHVCALLSGCTRCLESILWGCAARSRRTISERHHPTETFVTFCSIRAR